MSAFVWLSALLSALYFSYGVYVPFWGLWLASRDVTPEQIGLLMGLGMVVRLAGNFLILGRVTSLSKLLPLCRYLALLSLLCFCAFYWSRGFIPLLLVMLLANFVYPTLLPLSDVLASNMVRQINLDYGKVRLWGSAAFIAGSTLVGFISQQQGIDSALYIMLCGLIGLLLITTIPMRPAPVASSEETKTVRYRDLLRRPGFRRLLLVASLLQGSHAAYYGFSAIYWSSQGYGKGLIGGLWALGVFAEILMFAASRRFLGRFNPRTLLVVGAIGCLVRWSVLGSTVALPLVIAAQLLHAITFCITHLAAVRFMTHSLRQGELIAAQTLYSALSGGVIMALLTTLVGHLYPQWGSGVFWLMALLGIPALLIRLPVDSPGEAREQ